MLQRGLLAGQRLALLMQSLSSRLCLLHTHLGLGLGGTQARLLLRRRLLSSGRRVARLQLDRQLCRGGACLLQLRTQGRLCFSTLRRCCGGVASLELQGRRCCLHLCFQRRHGMPRLLRRRGKLPKPSGHHHQALIHRCQLLLLCHQLGSAQAGRQ